MSQRWDKRDKRDKRDTLGHFRTVTVIFKIMEYHKYNLTKKGKSICPNCERKTFVLYIDETGNPLNSTVGKCDRADNCGHHYTPKQYFTDSNISFDSKRKFTPHPQPTPKPQPSFIDTELLKKSLSNYEKNNFVQWLGGIVDEKQAGGAIERYFIGTSKHWDGSTVFWQIDANQKIRTGKIMQYNPNTGKRVKEPFNKIGWVHTVLKLDNFNLSQCLFGEHLLKDLSKFVAIVESEKTAIVASIYLPNFIWLACGGCEGLNIDKCRILARRKVILFPDAGKFDKWNEKAKILQTFCTVSVSSLIEQQANENERANGFDLCDYLIKFPLSEFTKPQQVEQETKDNPESVSENQKVAYVSGNGTLYIPTPPCNRVTYTVYPSVEAYNKRSELPKIVPIQSVNIEGMKQVFINLKTLKI
jgi:hypothetical protein